MSGIATGKPLRPTIQARVAVPFVLVTLIWSSTWLVIRDQIGVVPPSWSVAYRFAIACVAMLIVAAVRRDRLAIGARGHGLALLIGAALFACNFNFVYRAEAFITSGLVAIVFALLIVPNALLARIFLKQRLSARFVIGSAIALAGLALLFLHEFDSSDRTAAAVAAGIGYSLLAVLAASIGNVLQASERARTVPMMSLLGFAMLYGAVLDAAFAWGTVGPPVWEARPAYWIGLVYLGLVASALAFPLYLGLIRAIGPARAAYTSVLTPIIAMLLSTLFEGYRWTLPAVAGGVLAIAGLVYAMRARNPS